MVTPTNGYRLILDHLRAVAGRSAAGTRLPSEHELAGRYGVSRGTARRALDELTREGAAVRVQGKGTFVAVPPAGKRPAGGRRTIALVMGDVRRVEPLFLHAVEAACEAAGYRLLLASSRASTAREVVLLRTLLEDGCAGFLIRSYQYPGCTTGLAALAAAGAPFVLVDRPVPGVAADVVAVDHAGGARRLTASLLEQGHRRIALLLHRRTPPSAAIEERIAGYRAAHAAAGVPCDERLIVHCGSPLADPADPASPVDPADPADPADPDDVATAAPPAAGGGAAIPDSFRSVLDLLLAVAPPVTAWMGVNDLVAASALRHALDRGADVPQGLSIAGFDGSALATQAAIPLTTVAQPFEQIGQQAVARLLRRLADPTLPPEAVVLPTRLLPGVTTAPWRPPPAAQSRAGATSITGQ